MWPGDTHLLKEALRSTLQHANHATLALLAVDLSSVQQAIPAILGVLNLATTVRDLVLCFAISLDEHMTVWRFVQQVQKLCARALTSNSIVEQLTTALL